MNNQEIVKEVGVKSVPEFIKAIYDKIKGLENITRFETEFKSIAWFRGEGSEDYKLVPNLFRMENGSNKPYCNNIHKEESYKMLK